MQFPGGPGGGPFDFSALQSALNVSISHFTRAGCFGSVTAAMGRAVLLLLLHLLWCVLRCLLDDLCASRLGPGRCTHRALTVLCIYESSFRARDDPCRRTRGCFCGERQLGGPTTHSTPCSPVSPPPHCFPTQDPKIKEMAEKIANDPR